MELGGDVIRVGGSLQDAHGPALHGPHVKPRPPPLSSTAGGPDRSRARGAHATFLSVAVALALAVLLAPALVLAQPRGTADPAQQVTAPAPRRPPPPRVKKPMEGNSAPSDLAQLGLTRAHDGSYLYVDPSARFTARFQPDGTVHFADRWKRAGRGDQQSGQCCGLPPEGIAAINPFLAVSSQGPVEWFLRAYGYDLSTGAKTALLERTRDLRTRLAISWHLQQIEMRLAALEPELLQVWSGHSVSARERKAYLFQRWDECDEYFVIDPGEIPPDAITRIDEVRMRAAEDARRRIEAFIRRHAALGSPHGYTVRELKNLNGRRVSKQRFAPYRADSPKPPTSP